MLAALTLCAMSSSFASKAWADDAQVTTKGASQGVGMSNTTTEDSRANKSNSIGFNGANFMNNVNNGSGNLTTRMVTGLIGSLTGGASSTRNSGGVSSTSVGMGTSAGMVQTTATGVGLGTVSSGGGYGSGLSMGSLGFSGGSGIFSTAINKLLNLFGNVKLLLYVVAAFGLVGFAFMAIFGKVRWGWVCALAFGLAAVAAAGQIIDYVSQSGMGSTMGDTLGANAADFSTIN
jgi:hypothetical protein